MFYINNKKVKEWIVKGEGNDQFLHRVRSAKINNREFYSGNSSDSEFVDVRVYYEGQRIKTTPQLVRKTQLSSTTIRVNVTSPYTIMALGGNASNLVDFTGTAEANPTFKIDPSVTQSTFTVYLKKASNWLDTHSYSLQVSDYNFSSISSSGIGKDCGFENAAVYVMNGSSYSICSLAGVSICEPANHAGYGYIKLNLINPPDVGYNSALVHFGYLPEETAAAMGFTNEENPNGISKSSPDYWGWGCWVENEQWLWSDDELREIFSSTGDTIRACDWDTLLEASTLSCDDVFHWGVYDLDGSIIESEGGSISFTSNPTFKAGWIFDHDDTGLLSDVMSLEGADLSSVLNQIGSPQGTITLIIPFSQPTGDSGSDNTMSGLFLEMYNRSFITSTTYEYAEQNFGSTRLFTDTITGVYSTNISVSDGYLYCCSQFGAVSTEIASPDNVVSLDVGIDTSVIYVGARGTNCKLSVDINNGAPSKMNEMISSEYFTYYKLIPFISNQGDGAFPSDGLIKLTNN